MSTPNPNETIVKHDSHIHSATATQYRVTMHVVTRFNDGSKVADWYLENLMYRIGKLFGAVNVSPEYVGFWVDPDSGKTYTDPQKLYTCDVNSAQDCHAFRELAAAVRDELGQVCVYVTIHPLTAWLV